MKKKVLVVLIVCLAIIVMFGVKKGVDDYKAKKQAEQEAYEARNEAKDYTYSLESYNSFECFNEMSEKGRAVVLIKTYEQIQQMKSDMSSSYEFQEDGQYYSGYINRLERYDEAYFEEKDLILDYYALGSGSIILKFKRLDVVNGVARVVTEQVVPKACTDDMKYNMIYIEVSKGNEITKVE